MLMSSKERDTRREARKYVVLNEEELIRQVELRPILYDKSLKGYRKKSLRLSSWKEVSAVVGAKVDECRIRWRSLRDAFAKHYKYQNNSKDIVPSKKIKWIFYDQMSFIASYLDNSFSEIEDTLMGDFAENSEDTSSMLIEVNEQSHRTDFMHCVEVLGAADENKLNDGLSSETAPSLDDESQFIASIIHNTAEDHQNSQQTLAEPEQEALPTHRDLPSQCTASFAPLNMCQAMDSDEKFLLSCAPILQRLSHRKNALARLKIQQILYDIEFETKV